MKKILVVASMMLLGFSGAYAAGTAAGTQIQNAVTLHYKVGDANQTDISASDGNGFLVDNKNDVLVTTVNTTSVKVSRGAQDQVLTFTVKNEGNKVQDFLLTSSNAGAAFGLTDNFDATNQTIFVESGATPGYQAAEDTATYIDELAPDATVTVYVVADIPSDRVNGDASIITLTAQVAAGGATGTQGAATVEDTGADQEDTEQIVWADNAGETDADQDGKHSDASAYEVQAADLTVTKASCVIWDPANAGTNPKRIPGAVVRYTIQVANAAGAADATNISASDVLPGTVTYGTGTSGLTQIGRVSDGACDCANPPAANAGSVSESSGTVTANYDGAISANETQCAYFDVTIN